MSKSTSRGKRSKKWSPFPGNWSTSWSDLIFPLLLSGLVLVAGCGYRLTGAMPYALPEDISSLYLAAVNNPTTTSFLEPALRSEFRDELSRRGNIQWVDAGRAQGKLILNILTFRSGSKLENAAETTVRSEVLLRLEARLYSNTSGELLARSGTVVARESFGSRSGTSEREAQERAVELAAELAVQRLNQAF